MKVLASLVMASMMAVALPACAKEEPKASPKAEVTAPAETKKVCIKTKDAKTGKEVEKCRVMKKHQKHEGTKVPDGKKK